MASWIRLLPRVGTLASVALLLPIFPPLEFSGLVWFGLVPWLLTLRRCESLGQAALQGFWLQFFVGFGWAWWIPFAVPEYLGLPFGLGIAALVLNTTVHHLHTVPVAVAIRWAMRGGRRLDLVAVLVVALFYTGADWAMPGIFQHTLGIALHDHRSLVQWVEVGGALLLSWLILVVNLALFALVETARRRARWLEALPHAALALSLLGVFVVVGGERARAVSASTQAAERRVRVGVVQGNVSNAVKRGWRAGDVTAARDALRVYLEASDALLRGDDRPDLVVWPETAYPGIFRRPENEAQARLNAILDRFIAAEGTPFAIGAYDREDRVDRRVLRNALFFIEPRVPQPPTEPSPAAVYHKYILFPVGEALPFVDEAFVRRWLPLAGAFSRGPGARVFDVGSADRGGAVRVGPSICYEDLFPAHTIELARRGAELLVNVSNDSWFGDRGLPRFHLIMAKLRSVETRLPQVRATNTGYSALILPSGDIAARFDYGVRASESWTVPVPVPRETVLVRFGDWFGPTSLLVGCVGLLWLRRRS